MSVWERQKTLSLMMVTRQLLVKWKETCCQRRGGVPACEDEVKEKTVSQRGGRCWQRPKEKTWDCLPHMKVPKQINQGSIFGGFTAAFKCKSQFAMKAVVFICHIFVVINSRSWVSSDWSRISAHILVFVFFFLIFTSKNRFVLECLVADSWWLYEGKNLQICSSFRSGLF